MREQMIMTVRGAVEPRTLGPMLPHEHLMSVFGAEITETPNHDAYPEADLMATVVPALNEIRDLGIRALADCTAAYFGRSPALLARLSEATGVHILTNTGYYGAANDRYVPDHARSESAEQLARRWIAESREGVAPGIHPGFIKIGVDDGPLSDVDAKLVRAAALAHLETGLTIAIHTGPSIESRRQQTGILAEEGVAPAAMIWVHAQHIEDTDFLMDAAAGGAWIEFDNLKPGNVQETMERVHQFERAGLLGRVLLSHDGNGFPYRGQPRPFTSLMADFLPVLRESGMEEDAIDRLIRANPAEAFTIGVRS